MASWLTRLRGYSGRRMADLWSAVIAPPRTPEADAAIAEKARADAPVIWLLGKVQSGKTSIVRALTDSAEAEVGLGFKPCTRTARVFDYPAEAPVIRFLDTRGLGEAGYDPAEDIAASEGRAQLILVVMKALDHDQDVVLAVIETARRKHPDWPIVVAQTSLHEAYPQDADHPSGYAFEAGGVPNEHAASLLPETLLRSLAAQRKLFESLPGKGSICFVPIDFTREGDGYVPRDFGFDALLDTLRETAPAGLLASIRAMHRKGPDAKADRAHPHIVGYATAAGAIDAVPMAGLVAVPAVQAKMLHSLARIYDVSWNRRTVAEFAAAIGTGTAINVLGMLGVRQIVKLIPVYGQTAGAAAAAVASFATTFALGKAACVFLARHGEALDPGSLTATYRAALDEAFSLAKQRKAKA